MEERLNDAGTTSRAGYLESGGARAPAFSVGRASTVLARVEGALLYLVVAAIYVRSCSPFPASWDTGEMQVSPYVAGIPHPTGFPAFVLLGWIFTHVVQFGTVAWRMNAFCGLMVASAAVLVRALALELGGGRLSSLAAAFVFAFGALAWNKASHADVHALSLAFSILTLYACARFIVQREPQWLFVAALAFGFGLATHPNVVWTGPALLIALGAQALGRKRTALLALVLAVAPLLTYAFLPIRSAIVASTGVDPADQPPFNGMGEMIWDTNHPRTLDGFVTEVFGTQFGAAGFLNWPFQLSTYDKAVSFWFSYAPAELSTITIVLAAVGLLGALRERRYALAGGAVALGAFASVPFATVFAPVEGGDVARYLLPSFAATCALAALAPLGLALPRRIAGGISALVLALVAWHLYFANDSAYNARLDTGGSNLIEAVRKGVPDGAAVLTNWIDATSLAYGAYVDHSLGRRIPLTYNGDDVHAYRSWTKQYRVFIYANFALMPEVPHDFPKDVLIQRVSPNSGHQLWELRPLRQRSPEASRSTRAVQGS